MSTVNAVVNYVLSKRISTEAFREGMRTGTRASFHMDQSEAVVLLDYIVRKSGCTIDQAVAIFTRNRDDMLQATARSPKDMNFFTGLLISAVVMVIPGVLLTLIKGNMWLKVGLLAIVLGLFFALVYALAWAPRTRAKEEAWMSGGSFGDRLEKLHAVQEMPIRELILTYQKPQAIAFAVVALACVIGFPALWGKELAIANAFHQEMAVVVVSADNAGTRYVVYDVDEKRYIDKYLSDEHQAVTADDVRGVLRIKEGEKVVGRYSGQGYAYQRYVTIELVDQRTGKTIGSETVYGGDPPSSISVKVGTSNKDGYGSHPSYSSISYACERLIKKLEGN